MKNRTNERGVALVVVLIIASIFAVLAYTALAVSIHSLESTDTNRNVYSARQVAEGAVNEGAYSLLVDPEHGDVGYLNPYDISTATEETLKTYLLSEGVSGIEEVDSFPQTSRLTAYTTVTDVSLSFADSDIVAGDRDNALYRYHDDDTFSEDFPGWEYTHVQNTGDLVLYGVGEVDEPDGDTALFSFLRGQYPNVQWNFDTREAGVTEASRLGPYPYIETDHPYGPNQSRAWSVTYQADPQHSGRHITGLRLKSLHDQVQIDRGDRLFVSAWLENLGRFQKLGGGEIPPFHQFGGGSVFTNGSNEVWTSALPTTTIGLYFLSNDTVYDADYKYGFRVSGVRYDFDSDYFPVYYETPHPYDHIVQRSNPLTNYNIQVIYSPYQAGPTSPPATSQQMRIQFSDDFSLDPADILYLFNAADPSYPTFIDRYTAASPPPAGGYSSTINRVDPALPLCFALVLVRTSSADTDGIANYGYKVAGIEYTGPSGGWNRDENPVMQSPHMINLGSNDTPYNIPAIDPNLPMTVNTAGYTTIWQPAVPDTDAASGLGSVTEWHVTFSGSCDLTHSGPPSRDYVRLYTPGNPLATNGADEIYFMYPDNPLASVLPPAQVREPWELGGYDVGCGMSSKLEIEFVSDSFGVHDNNEQNFGYRVDLVDYVTDNGSDDDDTPPTVRSDMNFPDNDTYPAFGDLPYQYTDWWYSNDDPKDDALLVGLHFDRMSFDLDPGDRLEIYDSDGLLIATLLSSSIGDQPGGEGPVNPDEPDPDEQPGEGPYGEGPNLPSGTVPETIVDLSETYGWVLIPGKAALVRLLGDGDDNEGHKGFEIDHCGFVNGDLLEIKDYYGEYAQLAYDEYYDRTAQPLDAFRNLGSH
jgi:hypothetical protein